MNDILENHNNDKQKNKAAEIGNENKNNPISPKITAMTSKSRNLGNENENENKRSTQSAKRCNEKSHINDK